jgi:hypothetical protein
MPSDLGPHVARFNRWAKANRAIRGDSRYRCLLANDEKELFMPLTSVLYKFSHRLNATAAEAFAWATDYQPEDIKLLGRKGSRKVDRIDDDTMILSDIFVADDGTKVHSKKLIKIYRDRMMWTSTSLDGTMRHSQVLYEITADGAKASRLTFTGQRVHDGPPITVREKRALSAQFAKMGAEHWKHIAQVMTQDLKK